MHALLAQIASPANSSVGKFERINKLTNLFSNLLLFIPREGCKRVKFRPNQEWNCGLRKYGVSFMRTRPRLDVIRPRKTLTLL